jgi:hypothetical protein
MKMHEVILSESKANERYRYLQAVVINETVKVAIQCTFFGNDCLSIIS